MLFERRFAITLRFEAMYIAEPYWPELQELIDIQKESGLNRARTEKTRASSLATYLEKNGLTMEFYDQLKAKAKRPWYRTDHDDATAEIVMPSHQLYGCLIEACKQCPAGIRVCEPDNFRTAVVLHDMPTGKYQSDGTWARVVQPKTGAGQPLSNQRGLRKSEYIRQFEVSGTLSFFPDDMRDKGDYFQTFLTYAGRRIGVGAARKMNCGRFRVDQFIEQEEDHDPLHEDPF